MNEDQSRKRFEEWILRTRKNLHLKRAPGGWYYDDRTGDLWQSWKACSQAEREHAAAANKAQA